MKEKILKEGAANWFHGIGSVGGKLVLTNKTLYFEGHKSNIGKKEYEVELEDIEDIQTGFLNKLIIITNSGKEEFAVNGKKDWVAQIENAKEELE